MVHHYLKKQVQTLILILYSFCIYNCNYYQKESPPLLPKHTTTLTNIGYQRIPDKEPIDIAKFGGEENHAIVFFHGLNRSSYDFTKMQKILSKKFKKLTMLALKSVDKTEKGGFLAPSIDLSIKEQAKKAYEEINKKLKNGTHILFIGQSQGGLRAYTVLKEYYNTLASNGLFIEGLITIGTPWKGVPSIEHLKNPSVVATQLAPIIPTLAKINNQFHKKLSKHLIKVPFKDLFPFLFKIGFAQNKAPGMENLMINSQFIRHYVKEGLKDSPVPIIAIAGNERDFSQLWEKFPKTIKNDELKKLNNTYAALIDNDECCKHDMLLPVSSQLAESVPTNQLFSRKIIEGACHGNKVGITIKEDKPQLNHPKVLDDVFKFYEKHFYNN